MRADYGGLPFNTAIARLTELNNALTKLDAVPREAAEALVLMVAPWRRTSPRSCGRGWATRSRSRTPTSPWPTRRWSSRSTVTCVVQVKGKVRDRLEVPSDITEDALRELALAAPRCRRRCRTASGR